MGLFQIVILVVCSSLGFGIVNNLIGAARKPSEREDAGTEDGDQR